MNDVFDRLLLREITRCLRHDLNIPAFCLNLMMDRLKDKFEIFKDFEFKVEKTKDLPQVQGQGGGVLPKYDH